MRGRVSVAVGYALSLAACAGPAPRQDRSAPPAEIAPAPRPEPPPDPPPQPEAEVDPPPSWPGAELADCSQCGRRLIGMPNWTCEDGTRGGPVCKQRNDGTCGWVVVRCPAAKPGAVFAKPPPDRPPAEDAPVAVDAPPPKPAPPAPKKCGDLPDDATLKTWKVIVISRPACGPRPPPQPTKIRDLGDGTSIGEDRRRGCYRYRYGKCKHTKCLPPDTPIATPDGDIAVSELRVGMEVWTRDSDGDKVRATIVRASSVSVPDDHRIVRVTLADGRTVEASAGHPDAAGRGVEYMRAGMQYDGAEVTRVETIRYRRARTFDILPSGPTGVYWAAGVPLRSTLADGAEDAP